MDETEDKRKKIDGLLDYIKTRMDELDNEKEELRKFQEKDRERRCLQYATYHQRQRQFQDSLDEIEQTQQGGTDATDDYQRTMREGDEVLGKLQGPAAGGPAGPGHDAGGSAGVRRGTPEARQAQGPGHASTSGPSPTASRPWRRPDRSATPS